MTTSTNHVTGLDEFRAAWDLAKARKPVGPENKVSADGRVNIEGDAACLAAAIYTPSDPEFLPAVEPGVRPLVVFLIDELDCITYTSCEGHPPTADGYSPRRVGILPRDEADYARLMKVLAPAIDEVGRARDRATVDLRLEERVLTSDGPDVRCILVVFLAACSEWSAYAASVGEVQHALIERLKT